MKKRYSTPLSVLALSLCAAPALAAAPAPSALPTGGQVAAGTAAISQSNSAMTINQSTDKAILNWQSFNIGSQATVRFNQPASSSVALNRVMAGEASQIYGQLSANGQVYLVNPAGVIFGPGSRVDVGGLVASTLDTTDEDFLAGRRVFSRGNATGSIVNQGEITAADGGLVALLAPTVANDGVITARLGNVTLAGGDRLTMEGGVGGRLQLAVDPATMQTLIENRQLIVADGGQVLMTSKAADALAGSVVANSGTIQARTIAEQDGRILLLADMAHGEVKLSGKLDASAPHGGNGGLVETSAAKVTIADSTRVTTLAANGESGTWLIDPDGFTIAAAGGDMTGAAVSTALAGGNLSILSTNGSGADGDIHVNDTVSWNANTLTLTATNDINVNAVMTASGTASLDLEPGSTQVNMGLNGAGFYGRVDFPGRSGNGFLTINGQGYTVLNSLGAQGSMTATDLQGMNGNLAGKYALGSNIDAGPTSGWNAGAGFVPVGAWATPFTGFFDGLGHTINGLVINRPGVDYQGLFGLTGGATLRNVGLVAGTVNGWTAGGLVGHHDAGITSNVYNTGNVISADSFAGGLIGLCVGTITNSYATGNVTGIQAGGLVGSLQGASNVTNSYATGNVTGVGDVGGLFGYSGATVSNSYATGSVIGTGGGDVGVGGLIGINQGTVSNSYATGSVTGAANWIGGLVGSDSSTQSTNNYWNTETAGQVASVLGTGLTTAQMQQQASFAGWDFTNTWRIYEGHTAPLLRGLLTPLTVTANNASKTYDGSGYSSTTAYTASAAADASKIFGSVSSSGTTVGTHAIAAAGLYSNQQGYNLSYVNGTLTITAAAAPAPTAEAETTDTRPNGGVLWRATRMQAPEPVTQPPAEQPATPQATASPQTIEVAQLMGTQDNRLLVVPPNFIRLQEE